MNRLAAAVRELVVPAWPAQFAYATTVPLDRTPAAHREAGRLVALHALARAGCRAAELPPRPGRRPIWPAGFVGSIAHDDALAVAVAARADSVLTVGVDVEQFDALSPRDASVVLRDAEIEFVGDEPSRATMLWSAKESAYKAWCTGLDLDLDRVDPRDVHVFVESVTHQVHAMGQLRDRVAAVGALQVGSMRLGDLVVTLAWKLRPVPA
ncbi:MAG TPA: 4'-phosphopantetheinyl transferase superfamily protein [Acidimicrobiales bacterium]|nr:4'-phosphopantetheinyl transferase superfamily protein [Acidimicrobiales bacterium]